MGAEGIILAKSLNSNLLRACAIVHCAMGKAFLVESGGNGMDRKFPLEISERLSAKSTALQC